MYPEALREILCCPDCGCDVSLEDLESPKCLGCGRIFAVEDGILSMLPLSSKDLPNIYNDPDYQRMSAFFDDSSPYFTEENRVFKAIHESSHSTVQQWEMETPVMGWVVDIGCGQGYHWPSLQNRSRLIGLDIRMESLKKIKKRFPDAILIHGNVLSLPFKKKSIERAISIYALEHVYYLEDALAEISRILRDRARFFVGLPCEGGFAWTFGRKLTSERAMTKKYNVNYRRYIALEHCNTAKRIEKALSFYFAVVQRRLFPFVVLPIIDCNLTLSLSLQKHDEI